MCTFKSRADLKIIEMQRKFTVKNCSYFGNSLEEEIPWCEKFKFENVRTLKLFIFRSVGTGKKFTFIS